ncbi:MAG: glycosyltransferase family 2 protein [Candidatus Micrarchaeaceae archaeon]
MKSNIKTNRPYITVIISAHDRKQYLKDAINSVLNQTLDRSLYEIIVVKNFNDREIDKFIKQHNIRDIKFTRNQNLGAKFAEGLKRSRGDVVAFLEDDDLFATNKLAKVYSLFKNNENLVYVHNNGYIIDEEGKIVRRNYAAKEPYFNNSSISLRKDIVDKKFLKKGLVGVDALLYFFALRSGKGIKLLNDKLTLYRSHASLSGSIATKDLDYFVKDRRILVEKVLKETQLYDSYFKRYYSENRELMMSVKQRLNFYKSLFKIFNFEKEDIKTFLYLLYGGKARLAAAALILPRRKLLELLLKAEPSNRTNKQK